MPKLNPETEKARAQKLVNKLIENDMSISKTAKDLGVTDNTIYCRAKKKAVKDILQAYLSSDKLKKKLIQVAEDGLEATRETLSGAIKPNHHVRHKFWRDILIANKVLNDNGNGNIMIVLNYGHRAKPNISPIRAEE